MASVAAILVDAITRYGAVPRSHRRCPKIATDGPRRGTMASGESRLCVCYEARFVAYARGR